MSGGQPPGATIAAPEAGRGALRSFAGPWAAPPRVSTLSAAAIALAAPLAALGLGLLLRPWSLAVPFSLFFLATAITAWAAGAWPGVVATLLGAVGGNFFFLGTAGELTLGAHALVPTAIYAGVASAITFLAASVRHHAEERAAAAASAEAARDAARATQQQIESILRHITDGVTVQRRDGSLLFANDAAARLSGFPSAEDMLARRFSDIVKRYEIFDEQERPFATERLPGRRALAGAGPSSAMIKVRDLHTGELRWSHVTAAPIPAEGAPQLAVNVLRDVTAQKRAEDLQRFAAEAATALASSLDVEATLRTVAELAVPRFADWCAVDLATPGGGFRRVTTMHRDPAKIALARDLARDYPPDPAAPRGVPQVLRTGKPELYPEIPEELLAASAVDAEHLRRIRELGIRSGIVAPIVGRDRTLGAISLVASESGRRFTPADLELAVELGARAGLALENARLYADALEALQLRDAFIAVAGHELRTPLTALLLQVQGMQLLARKHPEVPELARLLTRLDKSEAQVRRLDRLVRELLDVSRIAAGRLSLSREEVDLAALAHEVAERQRAAAPRQAITVSAAAPVVGRWDRLRLDQVLTNLLSNAMKYGDGKPIDVVVERAGQRAALRVRDQGIGIAAADLARIFERFERAVPETRYAGMGLGLWITRHIVAAHGGEIRVASEPEAGTTFTVELPLDTAESP